VRDTQAEGGGGGDAAEVHVEAVAHVLEDEEDSGGDSEAPVD